MARESEKLIMLFTRNEALKVDLLVCKCGHRENNHFKDQPNAPCAHCSCIQYDEIARIGHLFKRT